MSHCCWFHLIVIYNGNPRHAIVKNRCALSGKEKNKKQHFMDLINDLLRLQHLDHMVRNKATGSPEKLAYRLNTSKRSIERMVSSLRDMGLPVVYDKERKTYCYETEVTIQFEILVDGNTLFKI